jgi:hypothetical protein
LVENTSFFDLVDNIEYELHLLLFVAIVLYSVSIRRISRQVGILADLLYIFGSIDSPLQKIMLQEDTTNVKVERILILFPLLVWLEAGP